VVNDREQLLDIYAAALRRVDGNAAVQQALAGRAFGPCAAVAVGKAGAAMMGGAVARLQSDLRRGLVITKRGHGDPGQWRHHPVDLVESSHPVPDASSLAAGERLLGFLRDLPPDLPLLVLVSGGASALVEVPRQGVTLADLQRANAWLLASGLPIGEMNKVRKALSRIKGGGLLHYLGDRPVLGLLISDVPNDEPAVIGSGLLVPAPPGELPPLPDWLAALTRGAGDEPPPPEPPELRLVATLGDALAAAAAAGEAAGLAVHRHPEFLEGEAAGRGRALAAQLLEAPPGLHLWGGETTVTLPARPGRGGRNQHLALAAAQLLEGRADILLLAAGTDGSDGPTEDAGGLVDGGTWQRALDEGLDPQQALQRADAGSVLAATGDLVHTGPTGTNVMDLVLALKGGAP
jgi:hydroxypyruvate reductase